MHYAFNTGDLLEDEVIVNSVLLIVLKISFITRNIEINTVIVYT